MQGEDPVVPPSADEPVKPDSRFDFSRDWESIPLFMDEISLDSVDDENEDLLGLKEMLEHEVLYCALVYLDPSICLPCTCLCLSYLLYV